jgi:tetratricopeptide (TPR) repeat protein
MNRRIHIGFAALVLILPLPVHAKTASQVFDSASASVVVVHGYDAKNKAKSQGSGVALSGGAVVTNCHVLKSTARYSVIYRNKTYPAQIRHSDWDRDVCSLSVPGLNAAPATLGATRVLKVGQRVYAIGAPNGLELTLSDGIISSLRDLDSGRYIQTTAPISPGSSGGGLFDEDGRLIGLPTFYLDKGQQLNFALPVEWVKDLPGRHSTQKKAGQSETDWLNQAIALEVNQDWPGLLEHAQLWTKAQAQKSAAWYVLGIGYAEAGQPAQAIEAYQQALRINPEYADCWNNLGITYSKSGQTAKALEAYQQALRINPEFSKVWNNLGLTYSRAGQSTQAVEAYRQALRIDPEYVDAWVNLGITYDDARQTTQAIEAYQQALRINPEYVDAWHALGLTYRSAGQTAKALEAYQQALRINPEFSKAWVFLGISYDDAGQTDKAIEAYRQALRIDPEYVDAWYFLGIDYAESGQSSRAMEVYRRLKILNANKAEEFFTEFVLP